MENTSPLAIEEKHRRYLRKAIERGGYIVLPMFTDNEVRAVAAVIEYNVELMDRLMKGYPKGHKSVAEIRRRVDILRMAHDRLAKLVDLKK